MKGFQKAWDLDGKVATVYITMEGTAQEAKRAIEPDHFTNQHPAWDRAAAIRKGQTSETEVYFEGPADRFHSPISYRREDIW